METKLDRLIKETFKTVFYCKMQILGNFLATKKLV